MSRKSRNRCDCEPQGVQLPEEKQGVEKG
jgi:hypothetical protein